MFDKEGDLFLEHQSSVSAKHPKDNLKNIDSDETFELLVFGTGGGRYNFFRALDLQHCEQWRVKRKSGNWVNGYYLDSKGVLIYWPGGMSLHHGSNGSEIWRVGVSGDAGRPVNLSESFVYSTRRELVFRDLDDGEVVRREEIGETVRSLRKYPGKDYLVGFQGPNLSFFTLEGEKVYSKKYPEVYRGIQFTQYDKDTEKELAYASKRAVHVINVGFEEEDVLDGTPGNYVFTGGGKELFKAVAENATVLTGVSYEEAYRETGKPVVSIGGDGNYSVSSFSSQFNSSGKKYYAGSREKLVYVAAIAARENASLTFKKDNSTRDFSNYSVKELQDLFIEKYEPHHVVVADLDSGKGVLASYMAAKIGALPVDYEKENGDNSVIKIENKIKSAFERIGDNRKTVFQGKFISILSGPRKRYRDPVEEGYLLEDPADGDEYYSDLNYGNLDRDRFLEASVGRYPADTGLASLVFQRSVDRESEKKAVVAAEYMHSNWPVILATFGGGLRYSKSVKSALDTEGFNTTHLVEYRANPIEFLIGLTPAELKGFMDQTDQANRIVSKFAGSKAGFAVKNAMIAVKAMKFAEEVTEIYYEYQWETYRFNLDRGLERIEDMEIPKDTSAEGNIEKAVMKSVFAFFWPDRKPRLAEKNLVEKMKGADIIYYQGLGNSTSWTLPINSSGLIKDRYTGKKRLGYTEIPRLGSTIVWDSSVNAGTRDAKMRESFFKRGASTYLGFSGVSYGAFAEPLATKFFLFGQKTGSALQYSVNMFRKGGLIYSPTTALKSGVREKMSNSLSLYGNPEMRKDPIKKNNVEANKTCTGKKCVLEFRIQPSIKMRKMGDRSAPVFDTDNYLIAPRRPITPLYSFDYELPEGTRVQDVRVEESYQETNFSLPKADILSSSGRFVNTSTSQTEFPTRRWNYSHGDMFSFVAAGALTQNNTTHVLEALTVKIVYITPVNLDLEIENRTVYANIYSDQEFKGELLYSLGETLFERTVDIGKGPNQLPLGQINFSSTDVEAYLVNDEVMAYDRETFNPMQPLEIRVFSPDMAVGETRYVTVVVENPNNRSVNSRLDLETGEKLQLGFLENRSRSVTVDSKSSKILKWRVNPLESGKSQISVMGSIKNFEINPSRESYWKLDFNSFFSETESVSGKFTSQVNSDDLGLELSTTRGRVWVRRNRSYENVSVTTPKFKAYITKYRKTVRKVVKTQEGEFISELRNGKISTRNQGVSRSFAQRKLDILEREKSKLLERYYARLETATS